MDAWYGRATFAGVWTDELIINGGRLELNLGKTKRTTDILYAIINDTSMNLNNGNVYIKVDVGYGIKGKANINGGNIEVVTANKYYAFEKVPNIDPKINWKITYNKDGKEEKETDKTDIYNIYNSPIIKISAKRQVGDLNGDGEVTGSDAVVILKSIAGNITLDDEQQQLSDVNKDGEITGEDAVLILKYIAGNIESL